jgi:hypothetical protein
MLSCHVRREVVNKEADRYKERRHTYIDMSSIIQRSRFALTCFFVLSRLQEKKFINL